MLNDVKVSGIDIQPFLAISVMYSIVVFFVMPLKFLLPFRILLLCLRNERSQYAGQFYDVSHC